MTQQNNSGEFFNPWEIGDVVSSDTAIYKVIEILDHGARGITLKVKVDKVINNDWNFNCRLQVGDYAVLKSPTFDTIHFDDAQILQYLNSANSEASREITALARIANNPSVTGIARIYDTFGKPIKFRTIRDLLIVIIEEFIKGHNLVKYLGEYSKKAGDSSFIGIHNAAQFLELAEKITRIVSTLHQNQVLHLDIWPKNIMMRDEEPVLIDFGGAYFRDYDFALAGQWERQSNTYMPPERISTSTKRLGRRADIYSLGGVFFYMATGEDPPKAILDIDFLKRTIEDRINNKNPQLIFENPCITDIIARCLRANKDQRTSNAETLIDEIRTARDAMTSGSRIQFSDTLEKLRKQGENLSQRNEDFFFKVFHLELQQVANKLDDVINRAMDVSGNHDELVRCLCKYLSVLEKGDLLIDFTVPWFWYTNNAGINGRFLSINKLLARKGVKIDRVFMICDEDTTNAEILEVIKAHVRATKEIGLESLSTKFVQVDSLTRVEKIREGWHKSVIIKEGKPILAVPVYDDNKNLRTIRFLSPQMTPDNFISQLNELNRNAKLIEKWPLNPIQKNFF